MWWVCEVLPLSFLKHYQAPLTPRSLRPIDLKSEVLSGR